MYYREQETEMERQKIQCDISSSKFEKFKAAINNATIINERFPTKTI